MKPICAQCKKEGHTKQNCWALQKRQDKPKPVFAATCVVLKEGTTANSKLNCEANQQNGKECKNRSREAEVRPLNPARN